MKDKARKYSLLDHTRFKTIEAGINNAKYLNQNGEIWECGAYKGGTALYMQSHLIQNGMSNFLRVFDTFCGIPNSSEYDVHKIGDVCGSTLEEVIDIFDNTNNVFFHKGKMPDTFKYLENSKISVAHIDVDNYDSVKACIEFIYPRVLSGGYIIIDDYNCNSCPGAKKAIDDFLIDKKEKLILAQEHGNPQVHFIKL